MISSNHLRRYLPCEIIRSESLYRGEVVANYQIKPLEEVPIILAFSPEVAFGVAQLSYPSLKHNLAVEEVRG